MFSSLIFVIPLELYLLYFELMGMPSTEKLMKILQASCKFSSLLILICNIYTAFLITLVLLDYVSEVLKPSRLFGLCWILY